MRTKLRSKVTLLFMMLGMLLAVPAVAFAADTIIADSDTVSTGDQASRDLGVVGPGATVQVGVAPAKPQVDFYLDCNGNNHLNSGEQATIAFNSAGSSIRDASNVAPATGSLSATSLTNITGPASWPADNSGGNACQTFANAKLGSSEVTIVAPNSAGTYTYKVAYVTTRGTGTDPNELDTNVSNLPGQGTAADPDLVTFTLKVDATKPTITLTKPAEGDSYDVDESVTVDYSCQDEVGGSGIKSCAGDLADGATLDTSTPGSYTFTVNAEDKAGTTETVTHNYTVVNPDNTGPVITPNISGTLGNNDWYASDVTLTWTVTDPESTVTSTDGCDRTDITADQQETTYTCTATSAGGQSSQSVSIKRDATDPTGVTTTLDRGPDHNGWYNAEVGWTTDGDDDTSGIASCDSGTYSGPDGTDLTVSGKCTDNAGNESDIVESEAFDYDATDPTGVTTTLDRGPDHNGWYNAEVGWTTDGDDDTSGIASCDSGTYSGPDGTDLTVSGKCTDNAGNESAAAESDAFDYDNTDPALNPSVSPNPVTQGASATASPGASDNLSGVASSSCGPVDTSAIGDHTVSCSATDNAGNSNTASASYHVNYNWDGFRQPVDNLPTLNTVKAGQSIPMKFSLSGNQGLSILQPATTAAPNPKITAITCPGGSTPMDAIEQTTTANNGLTYDATADQYNYVWKTQSTYAGKCYRFDMTLKDGTTHSALFKFSK
jgi:hypothetical protein